MTKGWPAEHFNGLDSSIQQANICAKTSIRLKKLADLEKVNFDKSLKSYNK